MLLGDLIHQALARVGVTPERVEQWVGAPCNCQERRIKLNQLSNWAATVVRDGLADGREYLERILG